MSLFKNRSVVGAICIVISLFICFGLAPLFNKGLNQKIEIVRLVKNIKAGDKITKDMLETVEVGSYNLPKDIVKLEETIIGGYAKADLFIGDYILSSKVSTAPSEDNSYLYSLDGTKQAISITIKDFANGLSGKIKSGDIVSVIASDYLGQGETLIPAELKYVEVISVTSPSGYDTNTDKTEEDEEKDLPSTITLLITQEQGNILASLEADGQAHISLVYRGDANNAKKFLDMQAQTLEEIKLIKEEGAETNEITEDEEEISEDVIDESDNLTSEED